MGENAVHGSDSDENAAIEGKFHFSERGVLEDITINKNRVRNRFF